MARNEEKSQSMLNRYLQMKRAEHNPEGALRRPPHTSMEKDLGRAERWRLEVVREVSQKIAEIQNETLGEARLRELNDEINGLMRMKYHWERRIRELGGANHAATAVRIARDEGSEIGGGGYRYYGAARKLKGVAELLAPPSAAPSSRTRAELGRNVDADYYGFRDDDDGLLVAAEARAQEARRQAAARAHVEAGGAVQESPTPAEASDATAVPTSEEMAAALLERKKQEILRKYLGPAAR